MSRLHLNYTDAVNPHFWPDDVDSDAAERAEYEANGYFRSATKAFKAEYDRTMVDISGRKHSPRWERERDAARAKYRVAVQPYVDLMPRVIADLLDAGEMSEETADAWNAVAISSAERGGA